MDYSIIFSMHDYKCDLFLRRGTAHESIVPYQAFKCKDGKYMIGAGNDKQVRRGATARKEEDMYTVSYAYFFSSISPFFSLKSWPWLLECPSSVKTLVFAPTRTALSIARFSSICCRLFLAPRHAWSLMPYLRYAHDWKGERVDIPFSFHFPSLDHRHHHISIRPLLFLSSHTILLSSPTS